MYWNLRVPPLELESLGNILDCLEHRCRPSTFAVSVAGVVEIIVTHNFGCAGGSGEEKVGRGRSHEGERMSRLEA